VRVRAHTHTHLYASRKDVDRNGHDLFEGAFRYLTGGSKGNMENKSLL
jgi:hypothetical protein